MSEKQIESQILQWLNFQPQVFAFKINTVGIYDAQKGIYRTNHNPFVIKGTADILGIAYRQFIAIEVKTPKSIKEFLKQNTDRARDQKAFLDKVNHMGGHAIVVSSLAQVIAFMGDVKQKYLREG